MKEIKICDSHLDELKTPLIFTFAFIGAEFWCPYCGKISGMMGAGKNVKSTARLRNRLRRFNKLSKDYLRSKSLLVCSETLWNGKWIKPSEIPKEEIERLNTAAKNWKYNQKP